MRFNIVYLLSALLVFTQISAAWPWPPDMQVFRSLVLRRADSGSSSGSTAASATATKTAAKSATTASKSAKATATKTATNTKKASGTASSDTTATGSDASNTATSTGTATGTKTGKSSNSSTITVASTAATGGCSMLDPETTTTTFYKIGNYVTFKWNYTSLSITPTAINVLASCTANAETYTLAHNYSVDATGSVTWDTGAYQSTATVPLLTETYTLLIFDAAEGVSATASAGHLGVYSQFTFGMYTPQPYTPLNQFKCATCSGAMSDMERLTLKFAFGTLAITIFSFVWFVDLLGVF